MNLYHLLLRTRSTFCLAFLRFSHNQLQSGSLSPIAIMLNRYFPATNFEMKKIFAGGLGIGLVSAIQGANAALTQN